MRRVLERLLPAILLAAALPCQGMRLVDRVEAPIAYVALDGRALDGRPMPNGTGATATDAARPVHRLLADPTWEALLGSAPATPAAGQPQPGASRILGVVRGVLAHSSGELELALTSIAQRDGMPLLVVRLQLQSDEVERLQGLLDEGSLASPHRTLGERRTYRLRDEKLGGEKLATAGDEQRADREPVELALVGSDLVIGNDASAMQELLAPAATRTSASPERTVLSADARFKSLRAQLTEAPGSLFVYADWQQLGRRLDSELPDLPGALLQTSGLGEAHRVLVSLSPSQADFAATVLLDFDEAFSFDGWLATTQSVPARRLVPELPCGGLGGLVVAVDLAALVARSRQGEHLLRDLRHAFDTYGLDFDRNVMERLGALGTAQLMMRPAADDSPGVSAVYAMRAQTKKAAADVFADLRRAVEAKGMGSLRPGKDRRTPDVLELTPHAHHPGHKTTFLSVCEDSVLVAFDADAIVQAHEDHRQGAKTRARREAAVGSALQRLGGAEVAGLFDLDLQPLFDLVSQTVTAAGAPIDLSSLPRRHIGSLSLDRRTDGSSLRICVISSR